MAGESSGFFSIAGNICNMDDSKKEMTRRELGCSSRFPGGSVPAPGRSTPTGESCEGQVAELPAGSAADIATAEGIVDWDVCQIPDPSTRGRSTLLERRKLTGTLEKLPTSVTSKSPKCEDDIIADSQDSVGAKEPGPRIISNVRLPRELRLRVVDDDIVNSPVTAVETLDAPIVIDSSKKDPISQQTRSHGWMRPWYEERREDASRRGVTSLGLNPSLK